MHIRTCPECGEEFRPEIVRCSDCGADLVDAHDELEARDTPPPEEPEGPSDYSPVFVTIESGAMREAAASLAAAGIAFRASGSATGFQLLVRSEDRAPAAQALAGREGAVSFDPEGPDAPAAEGGPCPACGVLLGPGAVECPECHLVLGEVVGACASCGAPLAMDGTVCRACGADV